MATFCERNIIKAAKDLLGENEAIALLNDLKNRAAAHAREKLAAMDDSLDKAAQDIIDQKKKEVIIAKRHAYLNIIARRKILKHVNRFKHKGVGLISYQDGVQSNIKNSSFSTSAVMKSNISRLIQSLLSKMDDEHLLAFKNKILESELAKELFKAGSSTNKIVQELAQYINSTYSDGVRLLNKEGAFIKKIKNYVAHQSHNPEKMLMTNDRLLDRIRDRINAIKKSKTYQDARKLLREQAYIRWRNFIYPLLDEKTFDGIEDRELFLRSSYDAITTSVRRTEPTKQEKFKGIFKFRRPKNLASSVSEQRLFQFKDGESWYEYNKKFGMGTVQNSVVKTLENMGKNIGLLKMWGPNPRNMFEMISKELLQKERLDLRIKKDIKFAAHIMDELTGFNSVPVDALTAKIGRSLRAWSTFSKLGTVLPSSFGDMAIRTSLLRDHGIGLLDTYSQSLKDLLGGTNRKDNKEILDSLGVWAPHEFGNMVRYFSAEDNPFGFTTKAMQNYFKLNCLSWWERTHREGAAMMISRNLGFNRNKLFSNLDSRLQKTLEIYGITSKEWDFIRENGVKPHRNKIYITPDGLKDASDESISKALEIAPDKLKKYQKDDFLSDMEDRLRSFYIDQADSVIIAPGAYERAFILRGTQPGTVQGELLRFIAQFKYYSLGYSRRVLGRLIYSHGGDGFIDAIRTGKADIRNITELMIGTAILGYIGITVKDLLKNLTPPPPNSAKTWVRAIAQGGGLGIYGDFIFGEARRGKTLEMLAGPVLGTLSDVADVASLASQGNNVTMSTVNLIQNNIPGLNLWFTKLAADYLFLYGVHERLHPGYLRTLQRRIEKNNDQKFIISPYSAFGT